MLLKQSKAVCDFVYEPLLWDRKTFNEKYDEVREKFYYMDSLSAEGIYHHKTVPMLIDNPEQYVHNKYLNKILNGDPKSDHLLVKFIRASGRIQLLEKICPDCKFIFSIRNPIGVLNSVLSRFSFYGGEFHRDDYPRFVREVNKQYGTNFSVNDFSSFLEKEFFYWYYMNRFGIESLKKFKNKFLFICHENFVADREKYCDMISDFIGLDKDPSFYQVASNPVGPISRSFEFDSKDTIKINEYFDCYIQLLKNHEVEFQFDKKEIIGKYEFRDGVTSHNRRMYGASPLYLRSELRNREDLIDAMNEEGNELNMEGIASAVKDKDITIDNLKRSIQDKYYRIDELKLNIDEMKKNFELRITETDKTIKQQKHLMKELEVEVTNLINSKKEFEQKFASTIDEKNVIIQEQKRSIAAIKRDRDRKIQKKQKEIDDIYSSLTWKFVSFIRNTIVPRIRWAKPIFQFLAEPKIRIRGAKPPFRFLAKSKKMKVSKSRIGIYDPGFTSYGHYTYFNKHVISLLSDVFKEVLSFNESSAIQKADISLPKNVKIINLPDKIRNLSKSFLKENKSHEKSFYDGLWEFIKEHNCDQLLLTSQGSGKNRTLWEHPPTLPYSIIVHIVWQIIQRSKSVKSISPMLRKANCLFVLEDYLIPQLSMKNDHVSRFPYYSYSNNYNIPEKQESTILRIGTIGIINERRNIHFILNAFKDYNGKPFEYYLYGKPIGQEGQKLVDLSNSTVFPTMVKFKKKFEYLKDEEYDRMTAKCDFGLIAYDECRQGQAPGVLYQFAKNNTPIIAPNIEPFKLIESRYKGIFILYDSLSRDSLNNLISTLAEKSHKYNEIKKISSIAIKQFINDNKRQVHLKYLKASLKDISRKKFKKKQISHSLDAAQSNQKSIVYFPIFENIDDLNDQIARTCWYLGSIETRKIYFPVKSGLEIKFKVPDYLDSALAKAYRKLENKLEFVECNTDSDLIYAFDNSQIVMQWKIDCYPSHFWENKFNKEKKGKQVWSVDKENTRFEGSHYIKVGLSNFPAKNTEILKNQKKFKEMINTLKGFKACFVFGTGPMVSQYKEFKYDHGISIICNSIIFDWQMLDYVKPKIIVFGDPIFHFGASRYAATFRQKLVSTIEKYKLRVVIPFNYYRLFTYHFPELEPVTVGIPFDYDESINLNLNNNFYLNPYKNILTMLMLPIAATLTRKIYILGADGRKKSENSYFWKHNPKTQINDEMQNIKAVHPAFFNIDYNEYYDEHLKDLSEFIDTGEHHGIKFEMLTPTYIALLRKRYKYRNKPYEIDFYPFVSIIITIDDLTDAKNLQNSLNSITEQYYENWEVVIVLNENIRKIPKFITDIKDEGKNVQIVKDRFTSIKSARHAGYKNAESEFIAFLNPGDVYLPGSLSKRVDTLMTEGSDAVFSVTKILNAAESSQKENIGSTKSVIIGDNFTPGDMHLSSLIVSKSVLIDQNIWKFQIKEDSDHHFLKRIAKTCKIVLKSGGATGCLRCYDKTIN
jgi:hypothetical protein